VRAANDEEGAARRDVVGIEVQEIGNLDGRIVHEPVLGVDAADETDDRGYVGRGGGGDRRPASGHPARGPAKRPAHSSMKRAATRARSISVGSSMYSSGL